MKTDPIVTDPHDAFHRVVHDAPGGVPALAARLGMPPGTLYNKANPNDTSHHLPTLRDVVLVSTLTGDHRVLHALAATLGEVCFPLPALDYVPDAALLEIVAKVGEEGGDFYAALRAGLLDQRLTRREFERVRREALEWMSAIAEALARLEGMLDE